MIERAINMILDSRPDIFERYERVWMLGLSGCYGKSLSRDRHARFCWLLSILSRDRVASVMYANEEKNRPFSRRR